MHIILTEQEFRDLKARSKREAQEVLAKLGEGLNTAIRVRYRFEEGRYGYSVDSLKELQRAVAGSPEFSRFCTTGITDGAEAFSAVTWVNLKDLEDLINSLK